MPSFFMTSFAYGIWYAPLISLGYFYGKDNELDIISMGPDVYDIHTVNEKISKKSIGRTWSFIKEILHNL